MEKKYTKLLEVLRSTAEFAQDYSNMQRCEKNVNTYDRMAAWACLQDVIHEYRCQINEFGLNGMSISINGATMKSREILRILLPIFQFMFCFVRERRHWQSKLVNGLNRRRKLKCD